VTIELDSSDPLFDEPAAPVKPATRLPRSTEAFAKAHWSALTSRSNDDVFPPLTRLCLYLQLRGRHGQRPVVLNNGELLDLGLSRWQKYRLLRCLEERGRIALEQSRGRCPVVSVLRPWW